MEIKGKVAVVTGAGSGIGRAAAMELAEHGVKGIGLADLRADASEVAAMINDRVGQPIAVAFQGDATKTDFRQQVYDQMQRRFGVVNICVPAAGITRDALAVRIDKTTGKATIYPEEYFRLVQEVNLIAPVYWGLEMVARIAEDRCRRGTGKWNSSNEKLQGTVIFIGSVSSQGNKGQVAYAATKR